ncbi:MAG: hypothetical protein WAV74_16795, partial [Anaerolineae bacterium]
AAGNVYVADTGNHRVQVFTAAGVFLRTFGRLGRGQGEFYNPRSIAVRGDRVYVADTNNSRVQVFTLQGDFVRQVGRWAAGDPDGLSDPVSVDADAAGRIFVLSLTGRVTGTRTYQRLSRFASDGAPQGSREVDCASGALAVDTDGVAYCSPALFGVIRILPSWEEGQRIGAVNGQPGFLYSPRALTLAPDHSLWVHELDDSVVKHYDAQGAFLSSFALPAGVIALAATDNRLLVLTNAPQVVIYDWSGHRLGAWGTRAFATPGNFEHPDHLAAAPDGTFYVLEKNRGRIQHLDANGRVLGEISAGRADQGSLEKLQALTVDALGRLYVLDAVSPWGLGQRIVRFSAGRFETAFSAGQILYPTYTTAPFIALAAKGNTLLAMNLTGQVMRMDLDGVRMGEWNTLDYQTWYASLAITATGRAYRVQQAPAPSVKVTTLLGQTLFAWGSAGGVDLTPGTFVVPSAVATDLRGRVFVLDTDNRSRPLVSPIFSSRLQSFDEDGHYLASWGSFGRGNGQFADAQAIAALPDGRIVVADSGNNRLQVFAPDGPLPPYNPLPGPTPFDVSLPPQAVAWEDYGPVGGSAPERLALPSSLGPESPLIASTRAGQAAGSTDGSQWMRRTAWQPPFVFYAGSRTLIGTDRANVWRSVDGGQNWTGLSGAFHPGYRNIVASPAYDANGVLFDASYGSGFWRSTDRGDTWELRSLAGAKLEYPAVARNADGTHTILISQSTRATPGKHWRSTDDGLTWQATGLGESHIIFSPNFAADGTVFALHWWNTGEAGIRRSTDGGVTWAQIGVASLPGAVAWSGLAISPNYATDHTLAAWTRRGDDQGTYLSTDAGQTWVGIAPREYEQYFVAFSPNYAQDHRLWRSKAGSGAHFLVTTDNGQSWQAAGNMPGATVHNLIGAGLQSDSPLWSLTPYGLLSTSPSGAAPTWLLDYSSASRRPKAPSVLAASPVFAADGTAVAFDSITTDGGESWQALSFSAELREARTSAAAFAPDFARSHTMAVAWGVYDRGQFGYFAVSTDGGASWQQHAHAVAAPIVIAFDAAWPAAQTICIGGELGLVCTSDLGMTWRRAGDPVGWLNVTGLVSRMEGATGALYAATNTHGVWRSADGGQTWTAFNSRLPNGHACAIAHSADLLAVGLCDGSIYLWQRQLTAWQRLGGPTPGGVNALVLRDDGIVWVGASSGIFRSARLAPQQQFPLIMAK